MNIEEPINPEKLIFPWKNTANDISFGHSSSNRCGLNIKFYKCANYTLYAEFTARPEYQNFPGVVHGGVVAAALDECMGQSTYIKSGFLSVSTKMETEWLKPTPANVRLAIYVNTDKISR